MAKNLLILESSPRKKGNSTVLAEKAAQAARQAGAEVSVFHLQGMKIAPCNACDGCKRKKVFCTTQDDMQQIYPVLEKTDALLLASPVYWFTYAAQLKACIDRWYGLWNNRPYFLRGKPVGIILTYGDVDLYTSGGINAIHTFETTFRFLGAPVAGWVYGSVNDIGDVQNTPDLLQAAAELGSRLAQ
mgnify:CR=1 FL=1|jgi:multimeric flavodoxin WrbA